MTVRCCLATLCLVIGVAHAAVAAGPGTLPTLPELEKAARARAQSTARVPLALPVEWPSEPALRLFGPDVPNVVRAMGLVPEAARPMADMLRAVFFEGSVASSTRAAMALRIAQKLHSPYVAAHAVRISRQTSRVDSRCVTSASIR